MTNPRSASVISIAASSTRVSTSSSSFALPTACSVSRRLATWRKPPMTEDPPEIELETGGSPIQNISSALPLLPRRMRSPCASACSVIALPLTNVP
jgi:hypothetical protein